MRTGKQSITLLALILSLAWLLPLAQAQALQDFNGKSREISDYSGKGKWLIVMIWASDCHVCNKEVHNYVDFQFVHADEDAQVLGISIDGKARKLEAEKFIQRHKVNFPNLIGEPAEVARLFTQLTGAYFAGTPAFLFYDPRGELRAQQLGAVPIEMIEKFIKQPVTAANEFR